MKRNGMLLLMIRTVQGLNEIEQQQQHRESLDNSFIDLSAQMMFDVDRRQVEEITQQGNIHITVLE